MTNVKLPNNWTSHSSFEDRYLTITMPGTGSATVDWRDRCVRAGMVWAGRSLSSGPIFTGRGWRERLVAFAVEWLQGIAAERQARALR